MKKVLFLLSTLLSFSNLFAQSSFSYKVLPNERITPYIYLWSIAGDPQGSEPAYVQWAQPQPIVPWLLEVSPDSFTMQSCADFRVIRMEIQAPAQTGFSSTDLVDLAAPPASDIALSLTITNSPPADTIINITAVPGQEVSLYFPIKSELPNVLFGCSPISYSPPDSLQKHRFWSPANGTWIKFTNDTIEVGPNGTEFKEVKLKSDVAGTFQAFFNQYREFRSFPVRSKIVFKVQNISATEESEYSGLTIAPPFPNPASDVVSFRVESAVNDEVSLELLDWSGRSVYAKYLIYINAGTNELNCIIGQLPIGHYIYRMLFQRNCVQKSGSFSVWR